jgi:predicted nucleic acid-binding protein
MRVFLDTNVLFSGSYASSGPPGRLLDLAAGQVFRLVVSGIVLAELMRNLRSKAPKAISRAEAALAAADLEVTGEAPDREMVRWYEAGLGSDAPVVAAAIAAEVDYFCTGDRRLQGRAKGGRLGKLRVVSPAELVRLLDEASGHTAPAVD